MPNLAGIFDIRAGATDAAVVTAKLARVLDVPGVEYAIQSWHDEHFGAVNLLTGICGNAGQPATLDGRIVLFLDGEIYNLAEVWAKEDEVIDGQSDPTEICLALYHKHGDDFVTELNGQFNILVYDRLERTVKIFNDRLAYRPFYYWCRDGVSVFGLEIKAILAALGRGGEFDTAGIFEFFVLGHCVDDRTLFEGIRKLAPGSILKFKDGAARVETYWRARYRRPVTNLSIEDAADEFGRRICRAMASRVEADRRYGIFLSGGLDSRTAAGALAKTDRAVTSFTFGFDGMADLEYGRELAKRLGFDFDRISYDGVSLSEMLPKIAWRTECSRPFNELLSISRHKQVRGKADVVFTGHHGGVLTGAHILPSQFVMGNVRELAQHLLAKRAMLRVAALERCFKSTFLKDAYPQFVERLERALSAIDESRMPLICNLWDLTVREPRFTFCSPQTDRYVVEICSPFTDNDVVEWMLSMPLRYLFMQSVYKQMIVRSFPEAAEVPLAKTGRRLSRHVLFDMAGLALLSGLKKFGIRSEPAGIPEDPGDLESYVETRLEWDLFPSECFDLDGIRQAMRTELTSTDTPKTLFALLSLAESARLFCGSAPSDPPPETWPDV